MIGHSIMIVDDEVAILRSLQRLLHHENYSINVFDNPIQALECFKKQSVPLIISDLRMPKMDGMTLLKEIKSISPDTVRIILTGFAEIKTVISAINEGEVYRFITKPWNDEELKIIIRQALANYDLIMDNKRLLRMVERQRDILAEIEAHFPDVAKLPKMKDGAFIIEKTSETLEDFLKRYFPEKR